MSLLLTHHERERFIAWCIEEHDAIRSLATRLLEMHRDRDIDDQVRQLWQKAKACEMVRTILEGKSSVSKLKELKLREDG